MPHADHQYLEDYHCQFHAAELSLVPSVLYIPKVHCDLLGKSNGINSFSIFAGRLLGGVLHGWCICMKQCD